MKEGRAAIREVTRAAIRAAIPEVTRAGIPAAIRAVTWWRLWRWRKRWAQWRLG